MRLFSFADKKELRILLNNKKWVGAHWGYLEGIYACSALIMYPFYLSYKTQKRVHFCARVVRAFLALSLSLSPNCVCTFNWRVLFLATYILNNAKCRWIARIKATTKTTQLQMRKYGMYLATCVRSGIHEHVKMLHKHRQHRHLRQRCFYVCFLGFLWIFITLID